MDAVRVSLRSFVDSVGDGVDDAFSCYTTLQFLIGFPRPWWFCYIGGCRQHQFPMQRIDGVEISHRALVR